MKQNGDVESLDVSDEEKEPGRKNLALTFSAEQGLLASLSRPRVYHGDSKYINLRGHPDNENNVMGVELSRFRVAHDNQDMLRDNEVAEQVASLGHQPIVAKRPKSDYSRLHLTYERRKVNHEAAVNMFHESLVSLCETLEEQVIQSSRDLRDYLVSVEDRTAKIFERLHDVAFMTGMDHVYVLAQWEAIDAINQERETSQDDFGKRLKSYETERAKKGGGLLRELLHSLVDVAYILPGEVERFVEAEANEINLVMIGNFKAHTDLLTRMKQTSLRETTRSRIRWEKCEQVWRHLRHDDAIARFHGELNSTRFTNPRKRREILTKLKKEQRHRHDSMRMPLISRLLRMAPPDMPSEAIDEVRKYGVRRDSNDSNDRSDVDRVYALKPRIPALL